MHLEATRPPSAIAVPLLLTALLLALLLWLDRMGPPGVAAGPLATYTTTSVQAFHAPPVAPLTPLADQPLGIY